MHPVFWLINLVLELFVILVVIRIIFSWLVSFGTIDSRHPVVGQLLEFFYRITEPALMQVRRVVPLFAGMDLSPLVLIIGLQFIRYLISYYLNPLLVG